MATSNEEIRDDLIRHQIEILAHARELAGRLIKLLNRVEPELRAVLRARLEKAERLGGDIGPRVTKRLAEIERAYRRVMRPTWAEVERVTMADLNELAAIEVAALTAIASQRLPVIVEWRVPAAPLLREIVRETPIDGLLIDGWLGKWAEADRERAMTEIRVGLLAQETPTQIGRRIFGLRDVEGADGIRAITRRGAQTLAQTATSAITGQARREIYQRNADIIAREVLVATLDSRTTPICRSLDGKEYPVGEGPQPPLHRNCRSLRVPAFDGETLATRPGNAVTGKALEGVPRKDRRAIAERLIGDVPAKTTYQEWLGRQSAEFQNEVLGRTRAQLFRRGEVTLDRFVDPTGRQWTLAELRGRLPAGAFEAAGL